MTIFATIYPAFVDRALGLTRAAAELTTANMVARALVVFTWGILLVRLGDRRLLGRNSGFDMLLVVILGSVLSRGVNGQASFFPTMGASGVLIFLHHIIASLCCRYDFFSRWIKGSPQVLISRGVPNNSGLRRTNITREDLDENIRLAANLSNHTEVLEARLERNGAISVVVRPGKETILDENVG